MDFDHCPKANKRIARVSFHLVIARDWKTLHGMCGRERPQIFRSVRVDQGFQVSGVGCRVSGFMSSAGVQVLGRNSFFASMLSSCASVC